MARASVWKLSAEGRDSDLRECRRAFVTNSEQSQEINSSEDAENKRCVQFLPHSGRRQPSVADCSDFVTAWPRRAFAHISGSNATAFDMIPAPSTWRRARHAPSRKKPSYSP